VLAFRIIAAVVLITLAIVLGSFFWSLFVPGAGRIDAVASRRIYQLCGFNAECKVRIGDIFDGKWDTFYEFGADVSQAEINKTLGAGVVAVRDQQRILVFLQNGHVALVQYARGGVEKPLEGEIEFEEEHHREQRIVMYRRNTWVRVNAYPVDSSGKHRGNYYVLSLTTSP